MAPTGLDAGQLKARRVLAAAGLARPGVRTQGPQSMMGNDAIPVKPLLILVKPRAAWMA
jgi:hypothetical protein